MNDIDLVSTAQQQPQHTEIKSFVVSSKKEKKCMLAVNYPPPGVVRMSMTIFVAVHLIWCDNEYCYHMQICYEPRRAAAATAGSC